MLNSNLYAIRGPNLDQHLRDNCSTRLESMVLLVAGMFQAGSVCLSKIAGKLPIDAQKLSLTRRLRRFLDSDTGCWHLVPFFGGSVRGAHSRQTTLHGGSERPEHGMTSNACQPPAPYSQTLLTKLLFGVRKLRVHGRANANRRGSAYHAVQSTREVDTIE